LKSLLQGPGEITGAALLLIYTATVCAVALAFPDANWDMIAYVASVLEGFGQTPPEVHANAFEFVRQGVSEGDFLVLTADRPYRIAQYADSDGFNSMLGFYRVKLLYIQLAQLLSHWTDPVSALRYISVASAALLGGLTLWWLTDQKSLVYAPLAIIALILSGFGGVARLATPDLLSAVFLVAGVLFYLKNRDIGAGIALLLAILVRPDHLALVGVMMVMSIVIRPVSKGAIGAFIIGFAAYVAMSRMAGHPGWWIQFWFTNVEYVPTLEGFDPPFSLLTYISVVVKSIVRSLVEEQWLAVLMMMVFLMALMLRRNFEFKRRETVVLSSILLAIAAKFVILPLHEERFYFAYLIAFGLILVTAYGRQSTPVFSSEASRPNAAPDAPAKAPGEQTAKPV
jgi:hypothetical protein